MIRLHPWLQSLSVALLVGGILVAPGLFALQSIPQRQLEVEQLRAEWIEQRERRQDLQQENQAAAPQTQLEHLSEGLPTPLSLDDRIEIMHKLAAAQTVAIKKAAYRLDESTAAVKDAWSIGRYEMQAELDGGYADIRRFLRQLLAADARLALESLELRRPPAGGNRVRVTAHLVFFVQESPR